MAILAQDTFQRSNNASSWGTSSDGNVWSVIHGVGPLSISSGTGVMGYCHADSTNVALGVGTAANAEGLLTQSLCNSSSDMFGIALRILDGNNCYQCVLQGDNLLLRKQVAGVWSTIASTDATPASNTSWFSLRFRVNGSTLQAKAWQQWVAEPAGWQLTVTDTDIGSAGQYGIAGQIVSGSRATTLTRSGASYAFGVSSVGTTRAASGRTRITAGSLTRRTATGRAKVSMVVAKGVTRAASGRANYGLAPRPATTGLWVSVGSFVTPILLDSVKVSERLNQRSTCAFSVKDEVIFALSQEQAVGVYADGVLLFAGFVDKMQTDALLPSATRLHAVVCKDLRELADKLLYKGNEYTNVMAGDIAADLHKNYLAAEGVVANYVSDTDTDATTFGQGTLANCDASSGDLTLAPAGSVFDKVEQQTADFTAGTLTNVVASSNALQLVSSQAIRVQGTCVDANATGANLNCAIEIWGGSQSTASGDYLEYSIWISSTSPYIAGGLNIINTDGTNWRDATNTALDQNDFINVNAPPPHRGSLASWADDQWYYRKVTIPTTLVGKTIGMVTANLTDNTNGTYTYYVKNVNLRASNGTLKATFYGTGNLNTNLLLGNYGYFNVSAVPVWTYEQTGVRVSPAYSIAGTGIAGTSLLSWDATTQVQPKVIGQQVTTETSLDGGASWQMATNHAAIPGLIPGQVLTGRTITFRETLSIGGTDPTLPPFLTAVEAVINPAPNATKTDVWNGDTTGNMGTGTLSNVTNDSTGLYISGTYKNWRDGDVTTGQTVFGSGTPSNLGTYGYLRLQNPSTSVFTSEKFTFAGQHQNFTAEMDVYLYPAAGMNVNLLYRTTFWGNLDYTFCYEAQLEPNGIHLWRGTNNSTGGSTSVNAGPGGVTFAQDQWYHLKVVVNGTSHKVYVDDVLYINATDSFYTGSGYLGARVGIGANVCSGYFNNFGVQDTTTGSRIAPSVSISSAGSNILGSVIDWAAVTPDSSTLDIQASTNGGANYFSCTKGGPIPGCLPGANVTGLSLLIKAVFTSNNANATPILLGVGWSVSSAYSSVGSRISPSLDISSVGRAGSTSVTWDADASPGTTLGVDGSPNGTAWTALVSGGEIPGITSQSTPAQDEFAANHSSNYSSTFWGGGSLASVTWDSSNNQLLLTGGSAALYVWNLLSAKDISLEVNTNQVSNGGLVARYTDPNNMYRIDLYDSSSSGNTQVMTLVRRVAGAETNLLTNVPINFVRGTYHTLKCTFLGQQITVYWDGLVIGSVNDVGGLAATGKVGFFQWDNTTSYYQSIQAMQLGDDLTGQRVYTRVRMTSVDPTATPRVRQLATSVRNAQLATGALIPHTAYRYKNKIAACLDDGATQSNGWWKIGNKQGELRQLFFLGRGAQNAPWPLATVNGDVLAATTPKLVHQSPKYRNRQYITGAIDHVSVPESKEGDGIAQSWALSYPVDSITSVDVNGATKTFGIQGVDTGRDFYYTMGQTTFSQDQTEVPLGKGEVVNVLYQGQKPYIAMAQSVPQQQALAFISATSGIIEETEDWPGITRDAADSLADARITEFAILGSRDWNFSTLRPGLAAGQILSTFVPEVGINDGNFLITGVDTTLTQKSDGSLLAFYDVQTTEGPAIGSWAKLFAALV